MYLSNKLYDVLKWMAQYLLPGLATLYFGLSKIWPLPFPAEIVGTIVLVNVFIGALLGLSTVQYRVNCIKLFGDEGRKYLSSKVYDILKWTNLVLLPAIAALYFGLSKLWGFPYSEQIVATVVVVNVFLGILLGISTSKFKLTNKCVYRLIS